MFPYLPIYLIQSGKLSNILDSLVSPSYDQILWDGVFPTRPIPSQVGVEGQTERNGGAHGKQSLITSTASAMSTEAATVQESLCPMDKETRKTCLKDKQHAYSLLDPLERTELSMGLGVASEDSWGGGPLGEALHTTGNSSGQCKALNLIASTPFS
ncbi:hypothetical protein SASPL_106366 [Salvia splendens]|uniref:Uncharacterized protein n=1 Tax=Salvia splendens TaxID=180675 RepID=A0A8X8YNH7_SALSN|nr:hypothetical protein SASPL_106366 [Salvia splendens]